MNTGLIVAIALFGSVGATLTLTYALLYPAQIAAAARRLRALVGSMWTRFRRRPATPVPVPVGTPTPAPTTPTLQAEAWRWIRALPGRLARALWRKICQMGGSIRTRYTRRVGRPIDQSAMFVRREITIKRLKDGIDVPQPIAQPTEQDIRGNLITYDKVLRIMLGFRPDLPTFRILGFWGNLLRFGWFLIVWGTPAFVVVKIMNLVPTYAWLPMGYIQAVTFLGLLLLFSWGALTKGQLGMPLPTGFAAVILLGTSFHRAVIQNRWWNTVVFWFGPIERRQVFSIAEGMHRSPLEERYGATYLFSTARFTTPSRTIKIVTRDMVEDPAAALSVEARVPVKLSIQFVARVPVEGIILFGDATEDPLKVLGEFSDARLQEEYNDEDLSSVMSGSLADILGYDFVMLALSLGIIIEEIVVTGRDIVEGDDTIEKDLAKPYTAARTSAARRIEAVAKAAEKAAELRGGVAGILEGIHEGLMAGGVPDGRRHDALVTAALQHQAGEAIKASKPTFIMTSGGDASGMPALMAAALATGRELQRPVDSGQEPPTQGGGGQPGSQPPPQGGAGQPPAGGQPPATAALAPTGTAPVAGATPAPAPSPAPQRSGGPQPLGNGGGSGNRPRRQRPRP